MQLANSQNQMGKFMSGLQTIDSQKESLVSYEYVCVLRGVLLLASM
jgi:hypothetical protein